MDTLRSRSTYTTYLCLSWLKLVSDIAIFVLKRDVKLQLTNSWLKQSLSMVIIVVLSEININFCGYSVVFCSKMVELRTLT